jgi:8-oxo-dGTP diphosphatase
VFVNARAIIERETTAGVEIVLQTRNKPAEGGKYLELPGGRIEEFESLIEGLKREVREETGLELIYIQGSNTKVDAQSQDTNVECLQPFAVYQTTKGPVDTMGVYFRCQATGELLAVGHETENIQWLPVQQIAAWLKDDPDHFSWVDRAGLLFYLKRMGKVV